MQSRTVQLALSSYECDSHATAVVAALLADGLGDDSVPALLTSNSGTDALSAAPLEVSEVPGSAEFFPGEFVAEATRAPDFLRCICFIANLKPRSLSRTLRAYNQPARIATRHQALQKALARIDTIAPALPAYGFSIGIGCGRFRWFTPILSNP
jgi:hypothetical protein